MNVDLVLPDKTSILAKLLLHREVHKAQKDPTDFLKAYYNSSLSVKHKGSIPGITEDF